RQETARVAAMVAASEKAKKAAADQVASEKERYAELEADRAAVERRIKERIEAEKRRAAAAAKRAAEKRAAEQRKARERQQQQSSRNSGGRGSGGGGGGGDGGGGSAAHHGFVFPVNGPITSPYGMRQHPVTGEYKLHDGTDFGVGCGTPIRAAHSGTVAERYWNDAWGNRLVIDHGRVDGHYVSTAYNHAIRYTVGVGQRVSTGQVIGYVGTTGWSTGCHLHLNLYLDGSVSNPMAWY